MSPLSKIIVTRTQPGCDALVRRLCALGYDAQAAPLLRAEATHAPCPCDAVALEGLVLTSAQALLFLPRDFPRHIPLYAVGYASAEAARQAGFTDVHAGAGDVMRLGPLVRAQSPKGLWLHLSAEEPAAGTEEALHGIGDDFARWPLYRTVPEAFDRRVFGEARILTVHSAKAAKVLAEAVRMYGQPETVHKMSLLCLSEGVLECLKASGFGQTYTAPAPDEDTLITTLRSLYPLPPR